LNLKKSHFQKLRKERKLLTKKLKKSLKETRYGKQMDRQKIKERKVTHKEERY
jgi:hypothetical protein